MLGEAGLAPGYAGSPPMDSPDHEILRFMAPLHCSGSAEEPQSEPGFAPKLVRSLFFAKTYPRRVVGSLEELPSF